MDFASVFAEYFVLVVFIASLILGYIIKTALDFIPNKYIPTILAIFGAVLNAVVSGASVNSVVYGALMGLSSTGAHQAFTKWIEKSNNSTINSK